VERAPSDRTGGSLHSTASHPVKSSRSTLTRT